MVINRGEWIEVQFNRDCTFVRKSTVRAVYKEMNRTIRIVYTTPEARALCEYLSSTERDEDYKSLMEILSDVPNQ